MDTYMGVNKWCRKIGCQGWQMGHQIRLNMVTPWKINGWNPKMEVWKIIFLFRQMTFKYHVNCPGCKWRLPIARLIEGRPHSLKRTAKAPEHGFGWKTILSFLGFDVFFWSFRRGKWTKDQHPYFIVSSFQRITNHATLFQICHWTNWTDGELVVWGRGC